MRIRQVLIGDVTPYERNPRKKQAIEKVAASIGEFGWQQPIVVDTEMVVIAGHTRLAAAKHLGLEKVPIHVASNLTPSQVKAYRLADNRSAEDAEWDEDLLGIELRELEADGYALDLTGFDSAELRRLVSAAVGGNTDPDAVPANPPKRAKRGDVWLLGRHRLVCGDSTSADDLAKLLDGATPPLCLTDPPYGVGYDPEWRNVAAEKGQIAYSASRVGDVTNDDRADWREVWALIPSDVIYHWTAPGALCMVAGAGIESAGYEIRNQLVWRKPHFPISRGHYRYQHEPCWYAVRKGRKAHWIGDAKQSSVWDVSLDENVPGGHSTQKPVELFTRAILNHDGDVLDPFVGSGSCLIACEQTGRICYAMELEPAYCDIVIERWQQFAGKKAKRLNGRREHSSRKHPRKAARSRRKARAATR